MHQPTSNKELPGIKVVHIERKIKKIKTIRERMQNVLILPHHRNPRKMGAQWGSATAEGSTDPYMSFSGLADNEVTDVL